MKLGNFQIIFIAETCFIRFFTKHAQRLREGEVGPAAEAALAGVADAQDLALFAGLRDRRRGGDMHQGCEKSEKAVRM